MKIFNRAKRQAKKTAQENAVMQAFEDSLETALSCKPEAAQLPLLRDLREQVVKERKKIIHKMRGKEASIAAPSLVGATGGFLAVGAGIIDLCTTGGMITLAAGLAAIIPSGLVIRKHWDMSPLKYAQEKPLFQRLESFREKLNEKIEEATPAPPVKTVLEKMAEISPALAAQLQAEFKLIAKKPVEPAKTNAPVTLDQLKHSRLGR